MIGQLNNLNSSLNFLYITSLKREKSNNNIKEVKNLFSNSSSKENIITKFNISLTINVFRKIEENFKIKGININLSVSGIGKFEDIDKIYKEVLDKLKEYFSPSNTAKRIFNFATSIYNTYLDKFHMEDSKESREEFVSLIKPAIQQGYNAALEYIDMLPDDILKETQKTIDIVYRRLDLFIEGSEKGYNELVAVIADKKIEQLDRNKDGKLTQEEAGVSLEKFRKMDKNNSGTIEAQELIELYKEKDIWKDLDPSIMDEIFEEKGVEDTSNPNNNFILVG